MAQALSALGSLRLRLLLPFARSAIKAHQAPVPTFFVGICSFHEKRATALQGHAPASFVGVPLCYREDFTERFPGDLWSRALVGQESAKPPFRDQRDHIYRLLPTSWTGSLKECSSSNPHQRTKSPK
jgi:hypothetical protein